MHKNMNWLGYIDYLNVKVLSMVRSSATSQTFTSTRCKNNFMQQFNFTVV